MYNADQGWKPVKSYGRRFQIGQEKQIGVGKGRSYFRSIFMGSQEAGPNWAHMLHLLTKGIIYLLFQLLNK